jgi:hypothetical protein
MAHDRPRVPVDVRIGKRPRPTQQPKTKTMSTLNNIRTLSLIGTAAFAFTACDKQEMQDLGVEAELNMRYEELALTIPANDIQGAVDLALAFDAAQLREMLASNGYGMEQLKEVRLTEATIRMEQEGTTFDALGDVHLRLRYDGQEVTVAAVPSVPVGATSLSLEVGGDNLMEVFQAGNVDLQVSGTVVAPVTQDMATRCTLGFKVVVATGS